MKYPVFLTYDNRNEYRRMLRRLRKLKEGKKHLTSWGSNSIELSFDTKYEADRFCELLTDAANDQDNDTDYDNTDDYSRPVSTPEPGLQVNFPGGKFIRWAVGFPNAHHQSDKA